MADDLKISVTGLAQFTRSLGKLDKSLPTAVRTSLNDAVDLIIGKVRPQIPVRTGRAAATLRPASTRTLARVKVGGRRAPYYPWLDFGGRVGRAKATRRPFIKEGRYLFPTLRKYRGEVIDIMATRLVEVARQAGVEVS